MSFIKEKLILKENAIIKLMQYMKMEAVENHLINLHIINIFTLEEMTY